MRSVKDRCFSTMCALPLRFREFVEGFWDYCLSECTFVAIVMGYLVRHQALVLDWSASSCVRWFPYLWVAGTAHVLKEHRTFAREHGRCIENFLPSATLDSMKGYFNRKVG